MKKGRRIFLVLFHFLLAAKAQFFYPVRHDAADFGKRILLVEVLEEDHSLINKLEKEFTVKAEQESRKAAYRELVAKHNDWIRQAVLKYWKVNEKIEFKTKREIDEILKDIKLLRRYAVLSTGWKNEFKLKSSDSKPIEVYGLVAYVAEATDRHLKELKRGSDQKTDYIFKVVFPTDAIALSDFVFAVQQFNFHLNVASVQGPTLERYRNIPFLPPFNKAGYEVIKSKTLLLPLEGIPEDKRQEIKKAYVFPLELVTNKFLEEAIDHQFAKHTYATMAWSDHQQNFAYFIVNASEGIILAELGHKAPDITFRNHALSKGPNDEVLIDYKQKMGFSLDNIVQLNHLLGQVKEQK